MHVNLLPFSFQRKLLILRLVRKWTGTWLICLVAAGCFVGFRYVDVARQQRALMEAEVRIAAIRAVVRSNKQLETTLAGMVAQCDELARLNPDQDALATLAVVARAVHATGGQAQIDSLQYHEPKNFAAIAKKAAGGVPSVAAGTITLHGIAASDDVVAALIESIGGTPVMHKVELRSSVSVETDGVEGRRFEIVCRYGGEA